MSFHRSGSGEASLQRVILHYGVHGSAHGGLILLLFSCRCLFVFALGPVLISNRKYKICLILNDSFLSV